MVQSGILLETQLHYIGTSILIIDVYQKESEIEEKSLQEMFCYLVPKYSLHQTLRCLKKKKKSLLVTYIPSYVPNTIIFLSHSCSCLFHLLPSLHVKFCSLLRVTNIACVTINIIPTKLCHTIVSQLLKICCE